MTHGTSNADDARPLERTQSLEDAALQHEMGLVRKATEDVASVKGRLLKRSVPPLEKQAAIAERRKQRRALQDAADGEDEYPATPDGRTRCVRRARDGHRCARYALRGQTQCRRHGGAYYERRLLATSRYAEFFQSDEGLERRYLRYLDDPDLCDLSEELALQRSLLAGVLSIAEAAGPAGIADPRVMATITELNGAIAGLADAVHRIEKRGQGWFSVPQVEFICDAIVHEISTLIDDPEVLDVLATRLEEIALPDDQREAARAYREARRRQRAAAQNGDPGGGEGRHDDGAQSVPDADGCSEPEAG